MPKPSDWIWFAENDLKAAKLLLTSSEPVIGPVIFHTQQCAEKALKAFLVAANQRAPRIHDLVILLDHCIDQDSEFKELFSAAAELSPFATDSRYPDDHYVLPDLSIAEYSVKQAKMVLDFVKSKI